MLRKEGIDLKVKVSWAQTLAVLQAALDGKPVAPAVAAPEEG